MGKKKTLTVAMHFDEGEELPEFINDLFDRLMEYPETRGGVALFAASWTNLFEEVVRLEEKLAEHEG